MRIIGGSARGRRLKSPGKAPTRPMTDRAREGLFSSIAAWIPQARVLDLFAGSGSLGLEALSRGAGSATFVERDHHALEALTANIEAVALGGRVATRTVEAFLASDAGCYDLVFADPPYAMPLGEVAAIMGSIVPRLRVGGLVILHRRAGEDRPEVHGLVGAGERVYGTAQLWRYERVDDRVDDVDDGRAAHGADDVADGAGVTPLADQRLGSAAAPDPPAASRGSTADQPSPHHSAGREPMPQERTAEPTAAKNPVHRRDRA